ARDGAPRGALTRDQELGLDRREALGRDPRGWVSRRSEAAPDPGRLLDVPAPKRRARHGSDRGRDPPAALRLDLPLRGRLDLDPGRRRARFVGLVVGPLANEDLPEEKRALPVADRLRLLGLRAIAGHEPRAARPHRVLRGPRVLGAAALLVLAERLAPRDVERELLGGLDLPLRQGEVQPVPAPVDAESEERTPAVEPHAEGADPKAGRLDAEPRLH